MTKDRPWHTSTWPPLAWAETAVKSVAIVAALIALRTAIAEPAAPRFQGAQLAQLIVLGLLSLGILAAIADRWIERERVAMVFVLLNTIGHGSAFAALVLSPTPQPWIALYAALMLVGDLVKIAFIVRHGYSVRGASPRALIGGVLVFALGYAVVLVLSVA
jgi:hypothetical protein